MSPKELLSSIRKKDLESLALEHQIIEVETRLTRISPVLSDMPSSHGGNDKMTDGVAKLIELKEKLNRKIDETCEDKSKLYNLMGKIENITYRTILIQRYMNYKSFEQIAVDMNYSYQHVCRLHGQALIQFNNMHNNESRNRGSIEK